MSLSPIKARRLSRSSFKSPECTHWTRRTFPSAFLLCSRICRLDSSALRQNIGRFRYIDNVLCTPAPESYHVVALCVQHDDQHLKTSRIAGRACTCQASAASRRGTIIFFCFLRCGFLSVAARSTSVFMLLRTETDSCNRFSSSLLKYIMHVTSIFPLTVMSSYSLFKCRISLIPVLSS